MRNEWLRRHRKIGEMRLGGMQPACKCVELPATFYIATRVDAVRCADDESMMIFCDHGLEDGIPLIWCDPEHIQFGENGTKHKLRYPPSWRTNWSVFTV